MSDNVMHLAQQLGQTERFIGAMILSAMIGTGFPDILAFVATSTVLPSVIQLVHRDILRSDVAGKCMILSVIETMLRYGELHLDSDQRNPVTVMLSSYKGVPTGVRWLYQAANTPIDMLFVLTEKYFL